MGAALNMNSLRSTPIFPSLLSYGGRGTIVQMRRDDTWWYYGLVQRAFAMVAGAPVVGGVVEDHAEMFSLHPDQKVQGVSYEEGSAGPRGAYFRLLQLPDITPEQVARAKAQLRRERDVVGVSVLRIKRMVPFPMPPRDHPSLMAATAALS